MESSTIGALVLSKKMANAAASKASTLRYPIPREKEIALKQKPAFLFTANTDQNKQPPSASYVLQLKCTL